MTNRRSQSLGNRDPRPRNAQDTPKVKYPLVHRNGELSIEFSAIGGLDTDPARGAYLRVHAPLAVLPGSPYALTLVTADSLKTTGGKLTYTPTSHEAREILTKASPTTDDVKDTTGDTVTALLQREASARAAADVVLQGAIDANVSALDARITTLEGVLIETGLVTLSGTSLVDVVSSIVTSDTSKCSIQLTRRTPGSRPGYAIVEDGTIVDNAKFFVYSTDSGDDGTLQYQVTVIP